MKNSIKEDIARLRSEVRQLAKIEDVKLEKASSPIAGAQFGGNFWTQNSMPWVSQDGRKAVKLCPSEEESFDAETRITVKIRQDKTVALQNARETDKGNQMVGYTVRTYAINKT